MTKAQRGIHRKLRVLSYARHIGYISKTCRHFGISRQTSYEWKQVYAEKGQVALMNHNPCPENPTLRTPPKIEATILYLRKTYPLGQMTLAGELGRYHGIEISSGGVCLVLKRRGMRCRPGNAKKRTLLTHRDEKQVPGHHTQVDVTFLKFEVPEAPGHRGSMKRWNVPTELTSGNSISC